MHVGNMTTCAKSYRAKGRRFSGLLPQGLSLVSFADILPVEKTIQTEPFQFVIQCFSRFFQRTGFPSDKKYPAAV